MKYLYLTDSLAKYADMLEEHLHLNMGLKHIKLEESPHKDLGFSPTITAYTSDNHILCFEVRTSFHFDLLDKITQDAQHAHLPLKLFTVVPEPYSSPRDINDILDAQKKGIGSIMVSDNKTIDFITYAQYQNLFTTRLDIEDYPEDIKKELIDASFIFKCVMPAKGCMAVYDIIEYVSTFAAQKTYDEKLWPKFSGNFPSTTWTDLIGQFKDYYNFKSGKHPNLTKSLLSRVESIITHRNDTGHRPKTLELRIKRDRELRTRFENACDILRDLVDACTAMNIDY